MRCIGGLVAVISTLAALAFAPASWAWTATLDGSVLQVAGGPGEANAIKVEDGEDDDEVAIKVGDAVATFQGTAPTGCTGPEERKISCPKDDVTRVVVHGQDGNDKLSNETASRTPSAEPPPTGSRAPPGSRTASTAGRETTASARARAPAATTTSSRAWAETIARTPTPATRSRPTARPRSSTDGPSATGSRRRPGPC